MFGSLHFLRCYKRWCWLHAAHLTRDLSQAFLSWTSDIISLSKLLLSLHAIFSKLLLSFWTERLNGIFSSSATNAFVLCTIHGMQNIHLQHHISRHLFFPSLPLILSTSHHYTRRLRRLSSEPVSSWLLLWCSDLSMLSAHSTHYTFCHSYLHSTSTLYILILLITAAKLIYGVVSIQFTSQLKNVESVNNHYFHFYSINF